MSTLSHITTAEQLLEAGDIGRCELISGELHMMTPSCGHHGNITGDLTVLIGSHVRQHKLGRIFGAETGFVLTREPDTVRAPDFAFITQARAHLINKRGYIEGAPDLAVEVVSPDDTPAEVDSKATQWIAGGCRLVWVVDPKNRTVTVYIPNAPHQTLTDEQTLDGGEVMKDFRVCIREFFAS